MANKLPIIIQTVVYKIVDYSLLFLMLKRTEDRGGFWTTVNGTLETHENVKECQIRELFEETQIKDVLVWGPELHRFSFDYKDTIMTVLVFSAEVEPGQEVVINEEHTEYKWLSFDQALEQLKFDDDKKALTVCKESIENK